MSSNILKTALPLLLVFFIIVLIGRYFFASHGFNPPQTPAMFTVQTPNPANSNPNTPNNSEVPGNTSQSQNSAAIQACSQELQQQVTAQKTQYDQGTILVQFNSSVDFATAQTILGANNATVDSQAQAEQSYPSNHLLTADIPKGKEILEVCTLRQDSRVHYASLNTIFNLHE